ncbi:MAG TPA: hypothetical protein DCP32_11915 [Anaerolineaceae bacterium]|nr:hypothetical protein [Anaerolineaceae bacterium]
MTNTTHKIKCGNKTFDVLLCERGQKLHDIWSDLVANHGAAEDIHAAMQDYYFHRNGVRSATGDMVIAPCHNCTVVAIDGPEHFTDPRKL